jgi:hypothetical protein
MAADPNHSPVMSREAQALSTAEDLELERLVIKRRAMVLAELNREEAQKTKPTAAVVTSI